MVIVSPLLEWTRTRSRVVQGRRQAGERLRQEARREIAARQELVRRGVGEEDRAVALGGRG